MPELARYVQGTECFLGGNIEHLFQEARVYGRSAPLATSSRVQLSVTLIGIAYTERFGRTLHIILKHILKVIGVELGLMSYGHHLCSWYPRASLGTVPIPTQINFPSHVQPHSSHFFPELFSPGMEGK